MGVGQFSTDHTTAIAGYAEFVAAGVDHSRIWDRLGNQVFLGSGAFVERKNPWGLALQHP